MKRDRETKITIAVVVLAVIILAAQLVLLWAGPAAAQSLASTEPQERPDVVQVRILTSDADLD